MILSSSYISLVNLRFRAFHGVLPQERCVGGDFTVTLRIGYDVSRAMASDDLACTLNYAAVYDVVAREMAIPSRLIEHVAGRIAATLIDSFPAILSIDLVLRKDNPPVVGMDGEGAEVEIHLINDKTAG